MQEILAPAGSMQALEAAVRAGADAVYLGASVFSARQAAQNFTDEELEHAVAYCHARGVQVHLALNTLIADQEMEDALALAQHACTIGIDAVIVQDLGLARLLRRYAPALPLHASTQMSIFSPDGIRELAEMGFSRVVLARELTRKELAPLIQTAQQCGIQTEVFVHGALCMSVSGQCLMSAVLGSRSANRGRCAQPCRLPFCAPGGTGYDLSLKDLSLLEAIAQGQLADIDSLKIEGRMKRPEYVAAAVHAVRSAVNGQAPTPQEQTALEAVFSRGGFTDGYFSGHIGKNMFGRRTAQDEQATRKILPSLHALYRRERQSVPISLTLSASPGQPALLTASDGTNTFPYSGSVVQQGTVPDENTIHTQLAKSGGTPFRVEHITLHVDPNAGLRLSEINALRRGALNGLLAVRESPQPILFERTSDCNINDDNRNNYNVQHFNRPKQRTLRARFSHAAQLPDDWELLRGLSAIYLPIEEKNETFAALLQHNLPVAAHLPRAFFGQENMLRQRMTELRHLGVHTVLAENIASMHTARDLGMEIHTGQGFNLFNTYALQTAAEMGAHSVLCSPEMTLSQLRQLGTEIPRGIFAYGRLPLMLTRNCPLKNATDCGRCDPQRGITDRMGIQFSIACRWGCSEIENSRPIWLADRLAELQDVDFLLLYFTDEDAERCRRVLDAYRSGGSPPEQYTRSLLWRGVP